MAKKKEETIDNSPMQKCITCGLWKSRGEIEKRDYADITFGRCQKSGLQCPPMWHCDAWEQGKLVI